MPEFIPIARSPLTEWSRRAGATFETRDGWQVAVAYPPGATAALPSSATGAIGPASANRLVDRSHVPTYELIGPDIGKHLVELCGLDVPLRRIQSAAGCDFYRLTPTRAIFFGGSRIDHALDVTGGWATISLIGPDAERILNKVTAVDLRERTVPVGGCCQGPLFGVNTLFGRFADRFDLHVCSDSAEFFWEVLLDAGAEFGLHAAAGEAPR